MDFIWGGTNGQEEDKAGVHRTGNINNVHGYREVEGKFKEYGLGLESRSDGMEKTIREGSLSLQSKESGPTLGGPGDPLEVSKQLGDMMSEADGCV